jgi:hypothetical protein
MSSQYQSTKGILYPAYPLYFLAEREILEKISHPFIVKLHFAF